MKFLNLRADVVKALAAEDAVRSSEAVQLDLLKRAMRTNDLAASLQLHCGYDETLGLIAMELGNLARNDKSVAEWVNFVGGQNAEPWNHWEWSLPPSLLPYLKERVAGVA